MSQKQNQTKTGSHLPPPPMPPEGRPFEVGATTAIVTTTPQKTLDGSADPSAAGSKLPTVTLRLKRVLKASPEKVYKAFTDADALCAWLPPNGFMGRMHSYEPRVGGRFRMSFYTANKSWENTFGGVYRELVPFSRIVHTDRFETDDPSMQGEMTVTIKLTPVEGGTLLEIEQAGIPGGPAASGAPYGWAQSLDKLAMLVEPELPF